MYYKCLELRPRGELNDQRASAPYPKRNPHGVQTLVVVTEADDPARGAGTKSGGDGEVEDRALW